MGKDYSEKKVALVLSGGAARGFVHLGVLKGLEELGIKPTTIVGTSMGAIIGGYYASYENYENIKRIISRHKWYKSVSFMDLLGKNAFIKGNRITKIFHDDLGNISFDDLDIELIVNASDVKTGETVVLRSGSIVNAIRASMSIPLLFEPQHFRVGGKMHLLVDGGLTANLFFDELVSRAKDFDLILLVNLNHAPPPYKQKMNLVDFAFHNFYIYQYRQVKLSLDILAEDKSKNTMLFKKKMIILSPQIKQMRGFEFDKIDTFVNIGHTCFKNKITDIKKILNKKSI